MPKVKCNYYVAKGQDNQTWLYFGTNPPKIINGQVIGYGCHIISTIDYTPLAESLNVGEVVKIYIRKETIKNK